MLPFSDQSKETAEKKIILLDKMHKKRKKESSYHLKKISEQVYVFEVESDFRLQNLRMLNKKGGYYWLSVH